MADQFVQVPVDGSGKKIDTSELTVNGNLVERQRINLADPTVAANIANVNSSGSLSVSQAGSNNTFAALSAVGFTPSFDAGNVLPSQHTLQAIITGAPATCTVSLQGSIDNINWFDLVPSPVTATTNVMFSAVQKPVRYVRGSVVTLTGGTAPTVTFSYLGCR